MNVSVFGPSKLFVAVCLAALPVLASAQAAAPSLTVTPSAPPASAAPTGPRVLTPADQRNKADAAAAPDLRPDRPVVPQISVPLGRKPPAPNPPPAGTARRTAPPGAIGDGAARCESLPGDLERATCRKRLAKTDAPG